MRLSDFDYHLPPELIAQAPLKDRGASRMLVLERRAGTWQDRAFRDLPSYLKPGDCLALNESRVIPCRLLGRHMDKPREVEVFLLRAVSKDRLTWQALVKPGRYLQPGARACISPTLTCEVLEVGPRGERTVRFACDGPIEAELERAGHMPLPPYIKRPDSAADRERYQTVYATRPGSVAAPTAGLHFTPEMLARCGVPIARLTLHVGLGTFQPLDHERVEDNHLHAEEFEIGQHDARMLRSAERIVAVGTTTARTLETIARRGGFGNAMRGETDIFIYPGFEFRATGALLTNFHLPKSSLLLLVSAFAGRELILEAYRHAVKERYRFYSYGDCMLVL